MLAVGKQRSITWLAEIVLLGTLAGCNNQTTNFENYPSVYGQKPAATTQMTNEEAADMQAQTDQYIRQTAGGHSPSDEIAKAKALLDAGTINAQEYEALKAKALTHAA